MWFQKKKTNYGKIVAITVAVVAAASAIAYVVYRLIKKYTEDLVFDCDDFLDECDDCDLVIDDGEILLKAIPYDHAPLQAEVRRLTETKRMNEKELAYAAFFFALADTVE